MDATDTLSHALAMLTWFSGGGIQLMNTILLNTHTNSRFTALLDFARDYPGELAPER